MTTPDDPGRTATPSSSAGSSQPVGFVQRATAPFSTASRTIGAAVHGVANLVKLEVVVTVICVFIPLILPFGDAWRLRPHISGYYDMEHAQYFYIPLTVAAMLFIVNGTVRGKHWYNLGLGLALLVLTFFNYENYTLVHNISAGTFFIGNAAVFVIFTPKKELWFKILLALIMAVALAGHFLFGWYSLFFAESFSLWVIALHFVLEAKGLIE
jgi:hypothetical protein